MMDVKNASKNDCITIGDIDAWEKKALAEYHAVELRAYKASGRITR